jgi:hypothetical protein
MPRHSHEIFDSKAPRRGFVQRVGDLVAAVATPATAATPASTSAPTHADVQAGWTASVHAPSPVETVAETDAAPHVAGSTTSRATSHVGFHGGPSASGSARSAALPTVRIGDKSRVVNGKAEWTQEDFALSFLRWFEATQPDDWGTWVWVPDIRKHYWPRFRSATGARYLQFGVLIHGLRAVTRNRPVQYRDETGRRRSSVEYWMGPT